MANDADARADACRHAPRMTPAEFRAWRRDRGLTQAQLGALLGLPCQQRACRQIIRYECGEAPIPHVVVLALQALDTVHIKAQSISLNIKVHKPPPRR